MGGRCGGKQYEFVLIVVFMFIFAYHLFYYRSVMGGVTVKLKFSLPVVFHSCT